MLLIDSSYFTRFVIFGRYRRQGDLEQLLRLNGRLIVFSTSFDNESVNRLDRLLLSKDVKVRFAAKL